MDNTFLQLVTLVVNLTNQVAALQQENAALKANLPVHDASEAPSVRNLIVTDQIVEPCEHLTQKQGPNNNPESD